MIEPVSELIRQHFGTSFESAATFQIRWAGSVFQAAGALRRSAFLYIFDKHNTALMLLAIIFAIKIVLRWD